MLQSDQGPELSNQICFYVSVTTKLRPLICALDLESDEDGLPPKLLEAMRNAEHLFKDELLSCCTFSRNDIVELAVERGFAAAASRLQASRRFAEMIP